MDKMAQRLAVVLGDAELAVMLAEAGYDTPRKIKAAKAADLLKIKGIGTQTVARLRKRLPKPKG